MTNGGIPALPARDFKAFLTAAKAALENPTTVDRMLQLLERNERVLEAVREERGELAVCREEHERNLARTRREFDEQLASERAAWDREVAERRKLLEAAECETLRRREWADKDRAAAAALRCKLEQKLAPTHEALGEFASAVPADPELSV
jgi:hypothetical protein